MRTHRFRALALGAALACAALLGGPGVHAAPGDGADDPALDQSVGADEASGEGPVSIVRGHVDLGPRLVDGQWTVAMRDDSGTEPVWRDPDQTVLVVSDAGLLDAPTGPEYSFMGATAGEQWYVIPQTQLADVVWLGWSTQDPGVVGLVDRGATMSIGPVRGPGRSWMFLQNGTFGEPLLLVDGQKDEAQDVWVDVNTHVHANWVFTEPGVYTAALTFSADALDGSKVSASTVLRFAVGSQTSVDEALAAAAPEPGDAASAQSAGTDDEPRAQGSDARDGADEREDEAQPVDAGREPASSRATIWIAGAVVVAGIVGGLLVWVRRRASVRDRAAAIAEARAAGSADPGAEAAGDGE
ncbi:choice-of-anchor M domain-containing protein [Actinomyces sp. B33]|uniref:choice-of-anchor M domain-containing protein n=1 Tax=Actinomyces sp. B33 TaxID=2942131 RepID=UPI002340B820|nr:choice-of-anchor M domain-containing protein [Actinomyces sp. B33]MDC4232528.1 choice-of-anchor M domain-containing protein [Actinomyces sp. B33]